MDLESFMEPALVAFLQRFEVPLVGSLCLRHMWKCKDHCCPRDTSFVQILMWWPSNTLFCRRTKAVVLHFALDVFIMTFYNVHFASNKLIWINTSPAISYLFIIYYSIRILFLSLSLTHYPSCSFPSSPPHRDMAKPQMLKISSAWPHWQ